MDYVYYHAYVQVEDTSSSSRLNPTLIDQTYLVMIGQLIWCFFLHNKYQMPYHFADDLLHILNLECLICK